VVEWLISKKSQQEMVGFVLIVMIVTIMGVIFLTLMLGSQKDNKSSIEISNVLQASVYYTTDCASDYRPRYRNIQDLVKECYKNEDKKCKDGRKVCDALEASFTKALDETLRPSEVSKYKAYRLVSYATVANSEEATKPAFVTIEKGVYNNCSSIDGGIQVIPISGSGSELVNIELEVCRGV
jgi:hypothetical protein